MNRHLKRDEETTIAENVVCLVQPGRDLIDVESGVPIKRSDLRTDWTVLLEKPNPDIIEGDFLRRLDGSELQVYGCASNWRCDVIRDQ